MILRALDKNVCIVQHLWFWYRKNGSYIESELYFIGAHGSIVVKALGYKLEGRGFET
jgi:hypothetical protein